MIFNLRTTHRNLFALVLRAFRILRSYGLSVRKMESKLSLYCEIMQQNGITPTFPITAKVLNRYPKIATKFSKRGVEFAIHGYDHIDCTQLTHKQLVEGIEKAISVFQERGIPFSGFRFPYLRWNTRCVELLGESFFQWDSSLSVLWDALPNMGLGKRNLADFQNMLNRYNYKSSMNHISLPRSYKKILEIPVSLPDDDLLDRLGIREKCTVDRIWGEILRQTYSRGELFTLQLHPERISLYKEPLKSLIQTANRSHPRIWFASLSDIVEWWEEKDGFSIDINKKGNDEYEIHAQCSGRATILVRSKDLGEDNFFKDYTITDRNRFRIKSNKLPIICVSNNCSSTLTKFLKNEGFIFETSTDHNSYSVSLDDIQVFDEEDETKILQKIDHTNSPLIRFWRWPNGCRSALSITGDIDALTSVDFFLRLFAH